MIQGPKASMNEDGRKMAALREKHAVHPVALAGAACPAGKN